MTSFLSYHYIILPEKARLRLYVLSAEHNMFYPCLYYLSLHRRFPRFLCVLCTLLWLNKPVLSPHHNNASPLPRLDQCIYTVTL